jgi:hypothetical protein
MQCYVVVIAKHIVASIHVPMYRKAESRPRILLCKKVFKHTNFVCRLFVTLRNMATAYGMSAINCTQYPPLQPNPDISGIGVSISCRWKLLGRRLT